jgi:hypothetical protein
LSDYFNNTYRIKDNCGNSIEFTHRVTVSDDIPPVMTAPASITIEMAAVTPGTFSSYQQFITAGGTATDNCAVDPASFRFVSKDSLIELCRVTYHFIYEIADFCGMWTPAPSPW